MRNRTQNGKIQNGPVWDRLGPFGPVWARGPYAAVCYAPVSGLLMQKKLTLKSINLKNPKPCKPLNPINPSVIYSGAPDCHPKKTFLLLVRSSNSNLFFVAKTPHLEGQVCLAMGKQWGQLGTLYELRPRLPL